MNKTVRPFGPDLGSSVLTMSINSRRKIT